MVQMSFGFLIIRDLGGSEHKLTCSYTPVIHEIDLVCMRVNDFDLRRFRERDSVLGDRHGLKEAREIVSRRINHYR